MVIFVGPEIATGKKKTPSWKMTFHLFVCKIVYPIELLRVELQSGCKNIAFKLKGKYFAMTQNKDPAR